MALRALDLNNVRGYPEGDFIVGSVEAPDSVVQNRSDVEATAGYLSYLTPTPPASCGPYEAFKSDFVRRYGLLPSGGFAVASYDIVILSSAALKATGTKQGIDLLRTVRSPGFRIQGLGVPLVYPQGSNQPSGFPLDILRLLPPQPDSGITNNTLGSVTAPLFQTDLFSVVNRQNICPKFKVGGPLPK